ncbi:MAG: 1-acyl-sn-glycerol-3-phosphate acyltransferase [Anaerolineaceae bacterium]|nr:1-acyl-sn-glycerol-3-phosphate acyltransferase [Anaerolineaceae bacterium]
MTAKYFKDKPEIIPDVDTLIDVLIFEVSNHFKIGTGSFLDKMLHWLGHLPAQRFAIIMQQFDKSIAERSIWEAARGALNHFTDGWVCKGKENVPRSGPLLVIANHPGAADSVAIMAAVERSDQRMIAIERPLLASMPNASRHMIYLEEENPLRYDIMRTIIDVLREGDSVIIFPRGNLEPDPGLMVGAIDSIRHWSESLGVFLSKAPDTKVLPLIIGNAYSPKAWDSIIARRAQNLKTRQQIAMVMQAVMQRMFPNGGWKIPIHVTVSPCLSARDISKKLDPRQLNLAIRAYVAEQLAMEYPNTCS